MNGEIHGVSIGRLAILDPEAAGLAEILSAQAERLEKAP
jgi:hypothetical protein